MVKSTNTTRKSGSVNMANKMFYGIGDFGFNMVINTLGSFVLFFSTTVHGINSMLVGFAIGLSMVWDAITDPITGFISDRTKSIFFGRRHGFMLLSIFGLALVNTLLWSMPMGVSPFLKFLWLLGCVMLIRTFSTLYQTPSAALGVELSNNINERTQIQSIRAIFLIIAIIVPVIIMGLLESVYGLTNPVTYQNMAYINGALCVTCGLVAIIGTYSYVPEFRLRQEKKKAMKLLAEKREELQGSLSYDEQTDISKHYNMPEKFSLVGVFKSFFKTLNRNANIKSIVLGYTTSLMSIVFLSALMIHVLTFTFKLDNIFVLMGAVFGMTILSQPLWIFISRKFDKKVALFAGLISALVGTCLSMIILIVRMPLINSGAISYVLLPIFSIMGAGAGAMYSMPLSMLGDVIAYESQEKSDDTTATYTGYTTLANKLSQSITMMSIGILLSVIGFQEGNSVSQTNSVQIWLGIILFGGIALSLIAGMLCYRKYNLGKEDLLKMIQPNQKEKEDF